MNEPEDKVNWLKDKNDLGLLVLRIGAPLLLFIGHGWPKLATFGERLNSFADPIGLGAPVSFILVLVAEVLCAALVALGLFTRLAVIPPIIFFLVAAVIQHADDPWARKEFALIYLVPFLALLFTGPGRHSLDAMMGRDGKASS